MSLDKFLVCPKWDHRHITGSENDDEVKHLFDILDIIASLEANELIIRTENSLKRKKIPSCISQWICIFKNILIGNNDVEYPFNRFEMINTFLELKFRYKKVLIKIMYDINCIQLYQQKINLALVKFPLLEKTYSGVLADVPMMEQSLRSLLGILNLFDCSNKLCSKFCTELCGYVANEIEIFDTWFKNMDSKLPPRPEVSAMKLMNEKYNELVNYEQWIDDTTCTIKSIIHYLNNIADPIGFENRFLVDHLNNLNCRLTICVATCTRVMMINYIDNNIAEIIASYMLYYDIYLYDSSIEKVRTIPKSW